MAPEGEVDPRDYYSRKFVVEDEVSKQVSPLTERFEAQIRGQQSVVEKFRFLSPAVLAQQALNDLSGTGYSRFDHFRSEVARFAGEWKGHFLPQVFRKTAFTAEALGELPRFSYRPERPGAIAERVGGATPHHRAEHCAVARRRFMGIETLPPDKLGSIHYDVDRVEGARRATGALSTSSTIKPTEGTFGPQPFLQHLTHTTVTRHKTRVTALTIHYPLVTNHCF